MFADRGSTTTPTPVELDRNELGAFLVVARLSSPRYHTLCSLLALNGLRISEALGADIGQPDLRTWSPQTRRGPVTAWLERGAQHQTHIRSARRDAHIGVDEREDAVTIIIGIDPHKATHTAVATDETEQALAEFQLAADRCQTIRLLAWAAPFEDRAWAVESAEELGKLLALRLVAEGEHVIDVPATLAARVRLLGSTKALKK